MNDVKPRALVTGASGFIGSHLVRHLVGLGWQVEILNRRSSSLDHLPLDRIRVHRVDGATGIEEAVQTAAPDVCFHLAGRFVGRHSRADIEPLVSSNVLFGTLLADALALVSSPPLLVNAGSFWQHANGSSYSPVALYAATKQAIQDILQYYAEMELLRVVNLKLFDSYGPGDSRPKLVNMLIKAASTEQSLPATAGAQLIDLLHVSDVSEALTHAATTFLSSPSPLFECFAVSSGAAISVRDLVAAIELLTGKRLPVQWGTLPYRPREMFEPWHAGERLPGWTPKVSLHQGLKELAEKHL